MAKVLVVHFSRTGNTRAAAEQVARALDADVEEIAERVDRSGVRGYVRSALEAILQLRPTISPARHDPTRYDLVVVATPVWFASLASPMRAYLARYGSAIPELAVVVTCGGRGFPRVLQQIEELTDQLPCAHVVVKDSDRRSGRDLVRVDDFIRELRESLPQAARVDAAAE